MPETDSVRRTVEDAAGARRDGRIVIAATGPDGLVAWIESHDDIAILLVAVQGKILLERSLARTDTLDFGYEGCSAQHLSWCGGRVVVVTNERSYSFLASVAPETGDEDWVGLSNAWAIDGDLLLWVDSDPGLVCIAALPQLEARPPLPFRGAPYNGNIRLQVERSRLEVRFSRHFGGRRIDRLALPTERQCAEFEPVSGLLDSVELRLFPNAEAPAGSRFIIEAAGYPFIRVAPERKTRWSWQPSPVWMPVYWHRYLVSAGRRHEAGQLLDLLDRLSGPLPEAEPEHGWEPGWSTREGQIELAARYVRRQSRTLAAACRAGGLPDGWYCLLFEPAPWSDVPGSRVDPSTYPPTLQAMFERLVQTKPGRL
jgi:hypothetical protein